MVENSDWENQQADDKLTQGFILLSFLIIWPLCIYLALHFNFKANPTWFWVMFMLFAPVLLGYLLKYLATRNKR